MARSDYEGKMCPQQYSDPNFSTEDIAFCFFERCVAWNEELGGCVIFEANKRAIMDSAAFRLEKRREK